MSCNTCQTKFSFFKKEHACPTCGFSHCSKCLKYQHNVPSKTVKKICGRCYHKNKSINKLSNNMESPPSDSSETPLAPIDIVRKLDSLENPAKPPIVMYTHANHWDKFKTGMEPADQEIVDRLRKLKGEDNKVRLPSIEEIKRRLAILKDEEPEEKTINIHQVDSRTDQEKTDDLIKEYLERLKLSSKSNADKEIEARLRALQDINNSKSNSSQSHSCNDFDDEDEHAVTKKIIEKAMAEVALEQKYDDLDELEEMEVETGTPNDDEDEKPSCVMCDQTVDLMKCKGCSGDLYCSICFEDNHDDFEMKKHKKVPFKPTNGMIPE
ncbi:abscission/NoCut checkpoint regulator isoform X1 [Vespa crabro]|uniref:abscission/NoCut checkpoint regulator isoform X1 n=2 Tax=Vespa crabro TaxID=7445 RepID=UPI001F025EA5|nr:abscission/NoCut checkpoint regulator isoform X1 [Vespa crabro]